MQQFDEINDGSTLPDLKLGEEDIIIPSLSDPPIPFAQVVIAFLYVIPIVFISIFFTSSFMDEKIEKRITILMVAPVRPFEIIAGKMLPYFTFSLISVIVMTLVLGGNILLALAIFLPVIFFIFAIYLMVPLLYRTFRDTTFISMLAVTLITSYLIFPAMFTGVNEFSYLSPLTLAVKMYRNEPFGLREYLFSAVPMAFIFVFALYMGSRVLNEEFLMGFRSLSRKLADAVYLALDRNRPYLSVLLLSLLFIPIVYLIQLVMLAVSLNLPLRVALFVLLVASIIVEELAKSVGVVVLYQKHHERPLKKLLGLAFVSAFGFLIGEKLLLYLSLSVVSETLLSTILFSSGFLLIPLVAHFIFTSLVCLLNGRFNVRYPIAILAATVIHAAYNLSILGAAL